MFRRAVLLCYLLGSHLIPQEVLTYENLALHKPAWQVSPVNDDIKHSANRAVDGEKSNLADLGGECTTSVGNKTAMWWVDLGKVVSIHHIFIQYATNNEEWGEKNYHSAYFLGFSVYVSITSNKENGVLCFKDTNYTIATIPNPVNISCPYHGRYIFYYNNRTHQPYPAGYSSNAYNDLCEVEVYGCERSHYYGSNCSIPCPVNCLHGLCDIQDGNCLACVPGFTGMTCDRECDEHKYGSGCNQNCGNCSNKEQCTPVNGSCPNGCDSGTFGENCDTECRSGFYGPNCQENCSTHCGIPADCDRITGSCTHGCQSGWKGDKCVESMHGGHLIPQEVSTYENLALHKSAWQLSPVIDDIKHSANRAVDGQKSNLADLGGECTTSAGNKTAMWWVDLGKVVSIHHIFIQYATNNKEWGEKNYHSAYFLGFSVYISITLNKEEGVLCFKDTNYTIATIPNPVNISCPYHGRYIFYYNNRTHQPYPAGYSSNAYNDLCEFEVYGCARVDYYGSNCSTPCPVNCLHGLCHIENGNCLTCVPGFTGTTCDKECDEHKYGSGCNKNCGNCSNKEQCNPVNGSCLNRCDSGSFGENCDAECQFGFYGPNCQENCSTNSGVPSDCDRITGSCTHECQSGWTGDRCVESEMGKRKETISFKQINILVIVLALVGMIAVIILVFLYGMRIRKGVMTKKAKVVLVSQQDTILEIPNTNVDVKREFPPQIEQSRFYIPDESELANGRHGSLNTLTATNVDDIITEAQNQSDTRDISIQDLNTVIKEKKLNGGDGFKQEFDLLPAGEQHQCNIGKRKHNIPKNRYKAIFPYDHSRVVLMTDNKSTDYINASYMADTNGKIAYIAAQGPKESTINDFWRMIWEKNITQIVMLTNLREKEQSKCSQYWPECKTEKVYGNIFVKNVEEKHYAYYVVRKYTTAHDKESRIVLQFHYTMWPDHGTADPLCLVVFHNHVLRTRSAEDTSPCLVHCSAGIGRTGTYIAFDALCKVGRSTGKINVTEYVKTMRANRMNMVQTIEQYIFVYLALHEEFKGSVERHRSSSFMRNIKCFIGDNSSKLEYIQSEFQELLQIRSENISDVVWYGPDNEETVIPCVFNKTSDKNLSDLTSSNSYTGVNINPIYVSSYCKRNAFMVTHCPRSQDVVPFLRLLIDHESDTVICVDPLAETESSRTWLPESSSMSKIVDSLRLLHENMSETDVKVTNVRIYDGKKSVHPVQIVEPRGSLKSPGDAENSSKFRCLVSYAIDVSTKGPITIISKNSVSLCGVFCAVFNSVQQIRMDDGVDVFTTVRQLQTQRPEFCSTLEDYNLVNRVLRDYIEIDKTFEPVYNNQ